VYVCDGLRSNNRLAIIVAIKQENWYEEDEGRYVDYAEADINRGL